MRVAFPLLFSALLLVACSSEESGSAALKEAFTSKERSVLASADRVEILSLSPPEQGGPPSEEVTETSFHGFEIHQRTEVSIDDGRRLIDSFEDSVRNATLNTGNACFVPHHALRVWSGEGYVDIVVCFICDNFYIYPGGSFNNMVLNGSHEKVWSQIFESNGVEIPEHDWR